MTAIGLLDELLTLKLSLRRLRLQLTELRRGREPRRRNLPVRKYRPDQPRVSAGNADGGQWTDGSGGSGPMSFEEWLAGGWASGLGTVDADDGLGDWRLRDDQAPIEEVQYRPRGGGGGGGGGGRWPEATLGQQARLEHADFCRNRDSQISWIVIQDVCREKAAGRHDTTLL